MPITRKFIDWRRAALPAAADYLLDRYTQGDTCRLDDVLVVLPVRRAGRLLLELLVQQAEARNAVLLPPTMITSGGLPELLYQPKRPFASNLVQWLAWWRALRSAGRKRLAEFIPHLPDDGDAARWLELGKLLWQQHRELASDGLDFKDVWEQGSKLPGFLERERWRFFHRVQQRYLSILDDLQLWDLQTARLYAIAHNECEWRGQIVLVGMVDMNRSLTSMLNSPGVARRVTALVFADNDQHHRFDEFGCLRPDAWQDVPVNLGDDQLQVVEDPTDEAEAVVGALATAAENYSIDRIAVGVPDESLVPQLQRALTQRAVPSRWVVGKKMPETEPYRILQAISRFLDGQRFHDFADLMRLPAGDRPLATRRASRELAHQDRQVLSKPLATRRRRPGE